MEDTSDRSNQRDTLSPAPSDRRHRHRFSTTTTTTTIPSSTMATSATSAADAGADGGVQPRQPVSPSAMQVQRRRSRQREELQAKQSVLSNASNNAIHVVRPRGQQQQHERGRCTANVSTRIVNRRSGGNAQHNNRTTLEYERDRHVQSESRVGVVSGGDTRNTAAPPRRRVAMDGPVTPDHPPVMPEHAPPPPHRRGAELSPAPRVLSGAIIPLLMCNRAAQQNGAA